MRLRTPVFVTVGTALLAAAAFPNPVLPALPLPGETLAAGPPPLPPGAAGAPAAGAPAARGASAQEGSVSAAALLAKVKDCAQLSNGMYRSDDDAPASVPVCDAKGAVFWKADLDIDCDGQETARCNPATDRWFQNQTAFTQSDGRALNAEKLPFIVVPAPSSVWDHTTAGIHGGTVAAVIHGNRVQYGVVGDIGPAGIIGEASYATARGLGITADPEGGGAASDVTYILFKDSEVSPIEDHGGAVRTGDRLARRFIAEN
ncbi:glycoside hydrolase family 75 protein [Streptomyces sp. NPDC051569]|uniref:glycoside hydrolase family 75 protein n=1 Tax=Streptomyces sp. NPDC051569 TaxID=3365661 RepID=UPI0037AB320C